MGRAIPLMLTPCSTPAQQPLIVAHRGASRDAPENTLAAFRLAWDQGADAIEGDFRLTRDNEIVCVHDEDTERVAPGTNLVVADSTLAALRELDVGASAGEQFAGERIPTLAEVLAIVPPGKKIYLEVKCGPEIVPRLCETITQSALPPDQVVVIAFDEAVIRAFKAACAGSKTYWLCVFAKDKAGHVVPTLETVLEILAQSNADGLDSEYHVPVSIVTGVREQGYEWHVWTVNDLEAARQLRDRGAQSITTDVPGLMKRGL